MAPFFACPLRFRLVAVDPAFISSHNALQEATTFCFVSAQKWLCMLTNDFFTMNPGISEALEDMH
jgi:hypothetical protein